MKQHDVFFQVYLWADYLVHSFAKATEDSRCKAIPRKPPSPNLSLLTGSPSPIAQGNPAQSKTISSVALSAATQINMKLDERKDHIGPVLRCTLCNKAKQDDFSWKHWLMMVGETMSTIIDHYQTSTGSICQYFIGLVDGSI